MNKLSLMEAWMAWFSGLHLDESTLWGLRILWWGRIGKGAEFLAGTVIVLEILGPARLQTVGASLRLRTPKKIIDSWGENILWPFFILIAVVICFFALVQIRIWVETAPTMAAISLISFTFFVMVLLALFAFAVIALGHVAALAFKGIAVVLQVPALDRKIRLLALFLLLLGFHFDLLSS